MPKQTSGSAKLLRGVGSGCTLDQVELRRFVGALSEFRLVDWQCKGQPRPDLITGSMDIGPGDIGRATEVLAGANGKLRVTWDVFPNGIPFPDIYRVNFTAGPGN